MTTTVPLMTNLDPCLRFVRVPCVNMLSTEVGPSHQWLMLDDADRDDWKIVMGDPLAIDRAANALDALRVRCPRSRIGWYGWPYPLKQSDVIYWSSNVAPLVKKADVAFHCCYSAGDGNAVERAVLARDCLAEFWPGDKPVVACVSDAFINPVDFNGIKRSMCRDEDMREQVEAARATLADSLYVWSGLPYRVWLMDIWRRFPETCNDAKNFKDIHDAVRRGRDDLLNLYGFTGDDLKDAASVRRASLRYSRRVLGAFNVLWKESAK